MVARAGGAQDQSLKQRQGEELQNDNRFQLWGFGTGAETNVARRDHASTELTCGCATQEPTAFHRAPHFFCFCLDAPAPFHPTIWFLHITFSLVTTL